MAGGKYLQKNTPQKGGNRVSGKVNKAEKKQQVAAASQMAGKKSNGKKVLLIVLIAILVLIIGLAIAGIIYYNSVLNMMSRPEDITVPTLSEEEINELLGIQETEEVTTESTSPMETWPEIKSDKNITNIMVIGQAARAGEDHRLSDSNILVSINRETKTITLTSIIRDLRVTIPAYDGRQAGFNRINVVYHLGSYYTGEKIDSMKMMEKCIEQNFGVKVDHTIEIDFAIFEEIVWLLGGVDVELDQAEIDYMLYNYGNHEPIRDLKPGMNTLDGYAALCYARMRKVGNGDWDRTARQREVISALLDKLKTYSPMYINTLFRELLPFIVTDMSNEEITNYAWEFIPMLTDLKLQSQTIPFENTWWGTDLDPDGVHNYVIDANLQRNGQLLRESIGYVTEE